MHHHWSFGKHVTKCGVRFSKRSEQQGHTKQIETLHGREHTPRCLLIEPAVARWCAACSCAALAATSCIAFAACCAAASPPGIPSGAPGGTRAACSAAPGMNPKPGAACCGHGGAHGIAAAPSMRPPPGMRSSIFCSTLDMSAVAKWRSGGSIESSDAAIDAHGRSRSRTSAAHRRWLRGTRCGCGGVPAR
jgi:hypothetical protein